jgi:hypothetical protein
MMFLDNKESSSACEEFKQVIPNFLCGLIIGAFSIFPVLVGNHKITRRILDENIVLVTPYFFANLIVMFWGVYFLLFVINPRIDDSFCTKIMKNISKAFREYTSLTLGVQISLLFFLMLFGELIEKSKNFDKNIGDPKLVFIRIIIYVFMLPLSSIIYHCSFKCSIEKKKKIIRRNQFYIQSLNIFLHRASFILIGGLFLCLGLLMAIVGYEFFS